MTELWQWTATELAQSIASGRISSLEATESALTRMSEVNPAVNAVVDPLPEQAMKEAKNADKARRAGAPLGPLHGVPITVKINVDYGGRATTNGVVAFKDAIAPDDSAVVRNLRRAGAVIIGRTNTPSFSMRRFTSNDLHGTTFNPFNREITPGGSSGGAAVATAVGIGAFGHGNDIGGSIRYPAYCCGLYGLRPSVGLIPSYNPSQKSERMIVAQIASVQGPIARCVADLRRAMNAMMGPDPRDVWQVPAPPIEPGPAHRPCRVAMLAETDDCPADPDVSRAIRKAGAILAEAGYEVEEVQPPSMQTAADLWRLVLGNEMRSGLVPMAEKLGDAGIKKNLRNLLEGIPDLDRTEWMVAFARRADLLREWQLFFQDHPIVLTANTWCLPMVVDLDQREDLNVDLFYRQVAPNTSLPFLGLPALAVPMGFVGTIPVGVQLIAGRFEDNLLLAAGEVLERATEPRDPVDPIWQSASSSGVR